MDDGQPSWHHNIWHIVNTQNSTFYYYHIKGGKSSEKIENRADDQIPADFYGNIAFTHTQNENRAKYNEEFKSYQGQLELQVGRRGAKTCMRGMQ